MSELKPLAEYIDREEFIQHIEESDLPDMAKRAVIALVRHMPAADVVHGEWEVVRGVLTPGGDPLLRCPFCKSRESEHLCGVERRIVWHYCPYCGAKMEGERKETE